jgi:hypothetical protein
MMILTVTARRAAAVFAAAASLSGCARETSAPPPEETTLNITHWSERTELFMEYPPLVAAPSSRRSRWRATGSVAWGWN